MSKIQELIDHGLQSRRGGNREEALRFFLSALGDDPENAWAAIEYAAELLHRGESDRAIEFLTQKSNEIKSKIDRQAVLIHLAQFYISLTLLDNAWAIYKEAIALIPSSSRPYKHFAASLRDAKKLSESTAVLRTGLTAVLRNL